MEALDCKVGILLVGPKGVGKSTFLYYILSILRGKKVNSTILWLSSRKLCSHDEDWNEYAMSNLMGKGKELP